MIKWLGVWRSPLISYLCGYTWSLLVDVLDPHSVDQGCFPEERETTVIQVVNLGVTLLQDTPLLLKNLECLNLEPLIHSSAHYTSQWMLIFHALLSYRTTDVVRIARDSKHTPHGDSSSNVGLVLGFS